MNFIRLFYDPPSESKPLLFFYIRKAATDIRMKCPTFHTLFFFYKCMIWVSEVHSILEFSAWQTTHAIYIYPTKWHRIVHKQANSDTLYFFGRKTPTYKATSTWITNTLAEEQQKIQYCANRPRQLESRKKQSTDNNKPVIMLRLSFSQPNQTSPSKKQQLKTRSRKGRSLLPQELPASWIPILRIRQWCPPQQR